MMQQLEWPCRAPHLAKDARLAELPADIDVSLQPAGHEARVIRLPVLRPKMELRNVNILAGMLRFEVLSNPPASEAIQGL